MGTQQQPSAPKSAPKSAQKFVTQQHTPHHVLPTQQELKNELIKKLMAYDSRLDKEQLIKNEPYLTDRALELLLYKEYESKKLQDKVIIARPVSWSSIAMMLRQFDETSKARGSGKAYTDKGKTAKTGPYAGLCYAQQGCSKAGESDNPEKIAEANADIAQSLKQSKEKFIKAMQIVNQPPVSEIDQIKINLMLKNYKYIFTPCVREQDAQYPVNVFLDENGTAFRDDQGKIVHFISKKGKEYRIDDNQNFSAIIRHKPQGYKAEPVKLMAQRSMYYDTEKEKICDSISRQPVQIDEQSQLPSMQHQEIEIPVGDLDLVGSLGKRKPYYHGNETFVLSRNELIFRKFSEKYGPYQATQIFEGPDRDPVKALSKLKASDVKASDEKHQTISDMIKRYTDTGNMFAFEIDVLNEMMQEQTTGLVRHGGEISNTLAIQPHDEYKSVIIYDKSNRPKIHRIKGGEEGYMEFINEFVRLQDQNTEPAQYAKIINQIAKDTEAANSFDITTIINPHWGWQKQKDGTYAKSDLAFDMTKIKIGELKTSNEKNLYKNMLRYNKTLFFTGTSHDGGSRRILLNELDKLDKTSPLKQKQHEIVKQTQTTKPGPPKHKLQDLTSPQRFIHKSPFPGQNTSYRERSTSRSRAHHLTRW